MRTKQMTGNLTMSQRNSGYDRVPDEVYETPYWPIRAIARHLNQRGCQQIWEPANGPRSKMATGLVQEGFQLIATNDDFLSRGTPPHGRSEISIVTNPPYGKGGREAMLFIEHALELKVPVVAMLLRV